MRQLVVPMIKEAIRKVLECVSSDEALMLAGVVIVVSVCGALGGIAGGLYRKKCGHNPSLVTPWDVLTFAMSGIVCAYGIILFGTGIANMFSQVSNYVKAFYLIGLSVVAGFFAMRLIPRIGSKIEQKLKQEIDTLGNKVNQVAKEGESIVAYQKLLSACQVALNTEDPVDVDTALGRLKGGIGAYPRDRMLNIYYGRLLRRKGDLKGAIAVLREYVDRMLKGVDRGKLPQVEKAAISVAYYNIACYHSLLIAGMPNEKERLLRETKEALAASNEYDSGIANAWRTDVDLKVFRESETDFSFGA